MCFLVMSLCSHDLLVTLLNTQLINLHSTWFLDGKPSTHYSWLYVRTGMYRPSNGKRQTSYSYGTAQMQLDTCGQITHVYSACRPHPSVRVWAYMPAKG